MSAKQENSRTFITALSQFGHAESSNLLPFIFLRLARNKLRDPYTINNFFFNQTQAQYIFKKTQPLPCSQTGSKTRHKSEAWK
jgi:hypothetical protein